MVDFEEARKAFAEKYECGGKRISNKRDVLWAVERAYIDTMPRTVEGHGEVPKDRLASLRNELADTFCTYFDENPPTTLEAFEEAHRTLCTEHFLTPYNKLLSEFGVAEQQYGKAQKIVNMTFKYIACFDDANENKGHFDFCHMPIDGFILEWCREHCDISGTVSWSNIHDFEYYAFQKFIRNWLAYNTEETVGNCPPRNPLEAEFVIWHEMTEQ